MMENEELQVSQGAENVEIPMEQFNVEEGVSEDGRRDDPCLITTHLVLQ
jgi:hypothetical protein